jgi:hypothetical protein
MLTAKVLQQIGREVVVAQGRMVVVEDEFGNPLVVVLQTSPRMTTILSCRDADFNTMLRQLGLDRIVVDSPLQLPGPPQGARKLDTSQIASFEQ